VELVNITNASVVASSGTLDPTLIPEAQIQQTPEMKAPIARSLAMFLYEARDESVVEEIAPPHGACQQM
jgi:hypothetical protein